MRESEYNEVLLHFENEVLAKYTTSPYKTVSCSDNIKEYDNVVDVSTLNSILSAIKVLTENGYAYKIVNYYPNLNGKVIIRIFPQKAMVGIVTTKGITYRFWCIKENHQKESHKEERIPMNEGVRKVRKMLRDKKKKEKKNNEQQN